MQKLYPGETHSAYQLRQVYRYNNVKLKRVNAKLQLKDVKVNNVKEVSKIVFPQVLEVFDNNPGSLLFVDEAVFTSGQVGMKTWQANRQNLVVNMERLSFPCIAVVAAVNVHGKLVAYLLTEKSITSAKMVKFLGLIKKGNRVGSVSVYLDNASVHRATLVTDFAAANNMTLLYAPPYSPEFQPIE